MVKFRPLGADDVEVRVGTCSEKGASLLLYKTARTDMQLLDETVGTENWQCDYRSIDGKLFCGIGCRFKDGEWVWKWDTGVPSNMEAQKGEASDARKRAGFAWGIGRELYTAPFIWVGKEQLKRHQLNEKTKRWQCYDDFRVTEMSVEDGKIVSLQICNMSNKGAVVYGGKSKGASESKQADDQALKASKSRMWHAIQKWSELHGRPPEKTLEGVKKRPEWAETREFFDKVAIEFEQDMLETEQANA